MTASPVVSIIIPIYNVADYLEQCLDSVLAQTLRDIEVICVNDGSTDSSPDIIDRYRRADERIVVIDKPNAGYGHSVNCGLDRARGEWIGIVEPDDFIDAHMYEDLVANACLEGGGVADIVKSSYWLYFDGDAALGPYVKVPELGKRMCGFRREFNVYEYPQVLRHHPSIWSAIYRKSFLAEKRIRMEEIPGAGWADNPWLYETMLQAESVVWIPGAYYRYRQTNPNGSCVLKDYEMVFDRLRDIRTIYARLGITDAGLKNALAQRTLNYVHGSILGNPTFSESDPRLQSLIQEAFEGLDGDLLVRKDSGINRLKREYYRDFMRLKAAEVPQRDAVAQPKISVVIALRDDRKGLWDTFDSILRQGDASLEILVADCGTKDRGMQIAQAVAERDRRFRPIQERADSVLQGFRRGAELARGDYVCFMRPGVRFMGTRCLIPVLNAIANGSKADVLVAGEKPERLSGYPSQAAGGVELVDCANRPEIVAANLPPSVYAKFFRLPCILSAFGDLAEIECDDVDGYALNIAAFARVSTCTFIADSEVREATRTRIFMDGIRDEQALINALSDRLHGMSLVGSSTEPATVGQIARGCMVHALADALRLRGAKRSGRRLYDALRDAFVDYGLKDAGQTSYANMGDYLSLAAAFAMDYDRYAGIDDNAKYKHIVDLTNKRDSYRRTCEGLRAAKLDQQGKGAAKDSNAGGFASRLARAFGK